MSRFLGKLDVELLSGTEERWALRRPLAFQSDRLGLITVPEGFDTDFASVPRLPVIYLLTGGTAKEAAVVHDWLYRTQRVTRRQADAALYEASGCGTPREPKWRRILLWIGVRIGGWAAWRENRKCGLWPRGGCA